MALTSLLKDQSGPVIEYSPATALKPSQLKAPPFGSKWTGDASSSSSSSPSPASSRLDSDDWGGYLSRYNSDRGSDVTVGDLGQQEIQDDGTFREEPPRGSEIGYEEPFLDAMEPVDGTEIPSKGMPGSILPMGILERHASSMVAAATGSTGHGVNPMMILGDRSTPFDSQVTGYAAGMAP